MSFEWTREQKLSYLALQKLFSEAGITEERIDQMLSEYREAESVEVFIGTLYSVAKELGLDGKFAPTWEALESEYATTTTLPKGWLSVAKDRAPAAALAQAADVDPGVVDEAMSTAQRLGSISPSRARVERAVDPVQDSDLIEKATQARQWDQQKKAYDALYKAGRFSQAMAGQEMGPYGFQPAITPRAISPEELLVEKGNLEEQLVKLQRMKTDIELGEMQSQRDRDRTRRELTQLFHKEYNKRLDILSANKRHQVDTLVGQKDDVEKRYEEEYKKISLRGHDQFAVIDKAAADFGATADAGERSGVVSDALNKLSGHPEAQYLLIQHLNAAAEDHWANEIAAPEPGWHQNSNTFTARAIGLAKDLKPTEENTLATAHAAYASSISRAETLRDEAEALQKEIDKIIMPGVGSGYVTYMRKADPFIKDTFRDKPLPGEGPPTVAAPSIGEPAAAADYVSRVLPGASLRGSDVALPTGKTVSYDEFSKSYPSAQVDPSTGAIVPEMVPTTMIDRSIRRLEEEIEGLDKPQLSDMDALKEDIMGDARFSEWMQRNGYMNSEKAFEFFKREYAQRAKMRGPVTDRQKRDAHILAGEAPAPLAERIGAVARTAAGPEGKTRRQRRRRALLNMLSPGPKTSRVTEAKAVEELPGEAPETAKVTPETAPPAAAPETETRLPTTWTDSDKWAEYTIDADGNITYVSPEGSNKGKTITVKPGDKGYDAILKHRTPEHGIEQPLTPEQEARGAAYVQAMTEGGVAPTGLPRKVTTTREELAEELAAVPGAETRAGATAAETERISLLDRLRFGKEERALGEKGEAAFKELQKRQGYEEARAAADAARARDEQPPAWAATILDLEPLIGLKRGEIQRAPTEPKAAPEEARKAPTGPGEGPGVPLAVPAREERDPAETGYLVEGIETARERVVPSLPRKKTGHIYGPGRLVGDEGVPPTERERRLFEAGMESEASAPEVEAAAPTVPSEKERRKRILERLLGGDASVEAAPSF